LSNAMPNYKGHLCGGLVAYLCVMLAMVTIKPSMLTACEWLCFTLAGALFPDVDVKSKGQKYFYYFIFAVFVMLMCQGKHYYVSCLSIIAITPMLVRHRGVFHQIWFLIMISVGSWAIASFFLPALTRPLLINMLFFIVGCVSHVVLDRIKSIF